MPDLFADFLPVRDTMTEGAVLLPGFARSHAEKLLAEIAFITTAAPFRHMVTPGGFTMSVAMTNCGDYGWITDRHGYRYDSHDPETGKPWPAMPPSFLRLAMEAAAAAGYDGFAPDACLINRYVPGAKMSLHRDQDEQDISSPIVSISLGAPATFLFGGLRRSDSIRKFNLAHGDIAVWGGPSRLRYHGISPLKSSTHSAAGRARINLTFRRAR